MDKSDLNFIKHSNTVNLLGIAAKAGKLCFGEDNSLNSIRSGELKILLLNSESSANTKKRFVNSCKHYSVPLIYFDPNEFDVASSAGKAHIKIIGVCDKGFSKKILEIENFLLGRDNADTKTLEKSGVMV